jgi:FkbH-like protein
MFRWATISNTTISPLMPRLKRAIKETGVSCEFFVAEHGDTGRQVFSPESELYAFKPDLIVLYLDLPQIVPGFELTIALEKPEARARVEAETVGQVVGMVKALRNYSSAFLLVSSFTVVPRTALGIGLDPVYRNSVRRMNLQISQELSQLQQCQIFDMESLWAEAGFSQHDRRFELIAQFPFGVGMQQALIGEWMRYFRVLQGASRKCVVLDLDNTLWGGVLGEDGIQGIQMGDTPEGRPFRRFQEALKALARRGVLLAISSKNNMDEAIAALREHPDMVLTEKDFAAMQINWDDKATNLKRLSQELNIGLQHMVFLDDNPAERGLVREHHPDVLVPDLPGDKSRYAEVLCRCELDTLAVTAEDLKRTQMYWEERQRKALQAEAPSFEHFLNNLRLEVGIERLSAPLLERAAQLCQRTNQFNLTTRRHNAEAISRFANASNSAVLLMKARDRFGEYGWSGLAIVETEGKRASIDTLLLSCRVLGKNAEFAFFSSLVKWAEQMGCTHIRGSFIPTPKNLPCKDFLPRCGLSPIGTPSAPGEQWFEAKLTDLSLPQIDHITVESSK